MRRWLHIIIDIFLWLLPYGGTVAVAILAWLGKAPVYLIVLGAIAAIAFGFWGSNQITIFRQIHQKRLSKYTDKEIEALIHAWLDITGFSVKRGDVDKNQLYFLFTVTDDYDRTIHIARQIEKPHSIRIWSDIEFSPRPDARRKLTVHELSNLIRIISLEMLRLGCSHQFTPSKTGFNIRLSDSVRFDDYLTEDSFKVAFSDITRAFTLVMGIIDLTLEEWGIRSVDLIEIKTQLASKK